MRLFPSPKNRTMGGPGVLQKISCDFEWNLSSKNKSGTVHNYANYANELFHNYFQTKFLIRLFLIPINFWNVYSWTTAHAVYAIIYLSRFLPFFCKMLLLSILQKTSHNFEGKLSSRNKSGTVHNYANYANELFYNFFQTKFLIRLFLITVSFWNV